MSLRISLEKGIQTDIDFFREMLLTPPADWIIEAAEKRRIQEYSSRKFLELYRGKINPVRPMFIVD